MFGTNEPFDYIQCSNCGCMQLLDEHIDMHAHYPNDYFSFNYKYKPNKIKDFIGKQHLAYKTGRFSIFGFFSNLFFKNLAQSWILKEYISFDSKILDVGCGSGRLLHLLSKRGFNHLTGVEPFNKEKIILDDKVVIFNNSIFEIEGKYDFIMLHYSFEHMPDPQKVIEKIINLLEENGTLLIRIPLIDSYAWRKYQTNWVQMDAPRHIYLHTFKSIVYLCNLQGLKLQNVIYDSSEYQFIQSEKYMRGLTFNNDFTVSKKDKKYFRNFATQLNKQKDGDQASFYFKKQN
jgi:SAM-dependent methyltransferase